MGCRLCSSWPCIGLKNCIGNPKTAKPKNIAGTLHECTYQGPYSPIIFLLDCWGSLFGVSSRIVESNICSGVKRKCCPESPLRFSCWEDNPIPWFPPQVSARHSCQEMRSLNHEAVPLPPGARFLRDALRIPRCRSAVFNSCRLYIDCPTRICWGHSTDGEALQPSGIPKSY